MAQAKKSTARKSSAKKASAKKKPSAKKGAKARKAKAKKPSSRRRSEEFSGKSVAELRKALTERLVEPLNLVMLTRDRIEETVEEAVTRGSMTRDAAQDLITGLVERGRRQTTDVLSDLEQLLGRGGGDVAARARKAGDQVLAQADRARRAGRAQLPDHRLRRPDRRPGPGPPRRAHPGGAAQDPRLRAPQREPQVGALRGRVEARLGVGPEQVVRLGPGLGPKRALAG
jgi:hypothetical protein